jgi:hypothetical protein
MGELVDQVRSCGEWVSGVLGGPGGLEGARGAVAVDVGQGLAESAQRLGGPGVHAEQVRRRPVMVIIGDGRSRRPLGRGTDQSS